MARPKQTLPEPDHADSAITRTGIHYLNAQHRGQTVTTAKKGTLCKGMQRQNNNRTVKKATEETADELNESLSESDESIHHIEAIKNLEEKRKLYTAKIKMNEIQKEFIIDTGSPVTEMPFDEQIVKQTELQKIPNRYQDVDKNELNFRARISVDIKHENNKQKMEILTNFRICSKTIEQ